MPAGRANCQYSNLPSYALWKSSLKRLWLTTECVLICPQQSPIPLPLKIIACRRACQLVISTSSTIQNRRRARNSAIAASKHPAARILSALLPHFGHRSNHSPGLNASLRGATVFFQPHSSQTYVMGLGFIGISALLSTCLGSLPSALSTTGIRKLDLLIELPAIPAVLTRNTVDILGHLFDHLTQFQLCKPALRDSGGAVLHAE